MLRSPFTQRRLCDRKSCADRVSADSSLRRGCLRSFGRFSVSFPLPHRFYTYLAATLKNVSRLSQRENFRHRLPVKWIKMSAVFCIIGYRFCISFCFCHVFALRVRYTENLYVEKDESWKAVREKETRKRCRVRGGVLDQGVRISQPENRNYSSCVYYSSLSLAD